MSQTPQDRAEHDVIPEHGSLVRRIMTNAKGGSYTPLHSLEEAQRTPDGAVVFEGDYGGIVYLTCPARLIRCSPSALHELLLDLDKLMFAYPDSAKVRFEVAKPIKAISGGSGGGVVIDALWIHRYFDVLKLDEDIRTILRGEQERLSHSTEELLKRAEAAEPQVARWPRHLGELYQSWAKAASGEDRAKLAAMSLQQHEAALPLTKYLTGRWLGDIAEMALEAGQDSKAETYAQRIVRDAWRAIAKAQ